VPPFLPSLGAIPFGPFNGIAYGTEVKRSLPQSKTGINRVFAVFRLGGIPEAGGDPPASWSLLKADSSTRLQTKALGTSQTFRPERPPACIFQNPLDLS